MRSGAPSTQASRSVAVAHPCTDEQPNPGLHSCKIVEPAWGPDPGSQRVTPDGTKALPSSQGGAYRLDVTLERPGPHDGPEARIRMESEGSAFATIGYNFQDGTVFLDRQQPTDTDLGKH